MAILSTLGWQIWFYDIVHIDYVAMQLMTKSNEQESQHLCHEYGRRCPIPFVGRIDRRMRCDRHFVLLMAEETTAAILVQHGTQSL